MERGRNAAEPDTKVVVSQGEVESGSMEGGKKHRDGNSSGEPAADKIGVGSRVSLPTSAAVPAVRDPVDSRD